MEETESHQKKDIEDMTSLLMEDEGSTFDEWVFQFCWMISKKWIPHITESTKTQKILEPFFWPPLYFSVGQFPDTLLLFSRVILYKPFSLVRNMGNAMTSSRKVCMVCLTITPRQEWKSQRCDRTILSLPPLIKSTFTNQWKYLKNA